MTESISLRVGGRTRDELRGALAAHGVLLNAYAETLLAHAVFDARPAERLSVRVVAAGELGLDGGGTLAEVFAAAEAAGLGLCPADTGPYLRLAMPCQENAPDAVLSAGRSPAGAIKVAAAPLTPDPGFPKGFYLRVIEGRQWLRGYRCDDVYAFSPGDRFAFRVPG